MKREHFITGIIIGAVIFGFTVSWAVAGIFMCLGCLILTGIDGEE